jgi:hypothetical protein
VKDVEAKSGTSLLRKRYLYPAKTPYSTVDEAKAKLEMLHQQLAGNMTMVQAVLAQLHEDLGTIKGALNTDSTYLLILQFSAQITVSIFHFP